LPRLATHCLENQEIYTVKTLLWPEHVAPDQAQLFSRPARSIVLPERISLKTLMALASVSRMVWPRDILIGSRDSLIAENATHSVSQTTVPWTGTPVLYRSAHFRPQNTSIKPPASTILMDGYGTGGGENRWRADRPA
jgi:hypothetical protein